MQQGDFVLFKKDRIEKYSSKGGIVKGISNGVVKIVDQYNEYLVFDNDIDKGRSLFLAYPKTKHHALDYMFDILEEYKQIIPQCVLDKFIESYERVDDLVYSFESQLEDVQEELADCKQAISGYDVDIDELRDEIKDMEKQEKDYIKHIRYLEHLLSSNNIEFDEMD